MGLSWYFFMELFKQFSSFFQAVFQLHVAIYAAPVAYRFWREPLFMAYVLTTVAALFKPYPTVADAGLAMALMSLHSNLLHRTSASLWSTTDARRLIGSSYFTQACVACPQASDTVSSRVVYCSSRPCSARRFGTSG